MSCSEQSAFHGQAADPVWFFSELLFQSVAAKKEEKKKEKKGGKQIRKKIEKQLFRHYFIRIERLESFFLLFEQFEWTADVD